MHLRLPITWIVRDRLLWLPNGYPKLYDHFWIVLHSVLHCFRFILASKKDSLAWILHFPTDLDSNDIWQNFCILALFQTISLPSTHFVSEGKITVSALYIFMKLLISRDVIFKVTRCANRASGWICGPIIIGLPVLTTLCSYKEEQVASWSEFTAAIWNETFQVQLLTTNSREKMTAFAAWRVTS